MMKIRFHIPLFILLSFSSVCRAQEKQEFYEDRKKAAFKPAFFAGYALAKIDDSDDNGGFNYENAGYQSGYAFGANLEMVLNYEGKLRFRPGLFFDKKEGGSQYDFTLGTIETKYSLSYLQAPLQVCYYLFGNKPSPYFYAGGIFGIALQNEVVRTQKYESNGQILEITGELERASELGFNAGFGFRFNFSKHIHPIIEYQFERTVLSNPSTPVLQHKLMIGIKL